MDNRYIELLKYEEILKKQGKSIWDEKEKHSELLSYGMILEQNLAWESKQRYQKWMKIFIVGHIDGEEFSFQFLELRRTLLNRMKVLEKDFKKLENLEVKIDSNFKEFSELLDHLFAVVDAFVPESLRTGDLEPYEINENQFRKSTEKILFEMERL